MHGRTIQLTSDDVQSRRLPCLIVTAASFSHRASLTSFLLQFGALKQRRAALQLPHVPLHVYDIGLDVGLGQLRARFPWVDVFRAYDFDRLPEWILPVDAGGSVGGWYAWKALIVSDALEGDADLVLWLDTGSRLSKPDSPEQIFAAVRSNGIFSPALQGPLSRWVHPTMMSRFDAWPLANRTNCNGAVFGFSRHGRAYNDVVRPWIQCARELNCINPPGANRGNHRQDQAAITVLVHQQGVSACSMSTFWNDRSLVSWHQEGEGCSDAEPLCCDPGNGAPVGLATSFDNGNLVRNWSAALAGYRAQNEGRTRKRMEQHARTPTTAPASNHSANCRWTCSFVYGRGRLQECLRGSGAPLDA